MATRKNEPGNELSDEETLAMLDAAEMPEENAVDALVSDPEEILKRALDRAELKDWTPSS